MPTEQEHQRARDLIMSYGWNAVAYQILNPGFCLWFSRQCAAVVGYMKASGRWVIAGAPVCAEQDLPTVIEELEADARAQGCRVCYFGASVRLYDDCRHPPRHSVAFLGAQPVWQPGQWDHIIASRASVRAQINRARNKHVQVEEWTRLSPDQTAQLRATLRAWLQSRPMAPMHFLVEPDTLAFLQDRRLLVALRDGEVCGFLVASPVPARNGWLIEQIIRHPTAPNGTNELLLHETMVRLARERADYVTLGLVPLSTHKPAGSAENPLWLRFLFGWGRAHGRRFYNFAGLESFKSKFCPHSWEPIYAIATEAHFSPRTLWAIAAAFSDHKSPLIHGVQTLAKSALQEANRFRRWITGPVAASR